jgi:hypothetical protein
MNPLFSILSTAYIAAIFLLADSPVVSDVAPFNPYSLLHIPLYGILTFLLIFSNFASPFKFINKRNQMNSKDSIDPKHSTNPINLSREMRSLFHWDSINPINSTNSINPLIAGLIALVVAIADEIHQAYIPSRNASIIDVFLDIVGISLCLVFIQRIEQISRFSKIIDFLRRMP